MRTICILAGTVGFPVAAYHLAHTLFHLTPLRKPVDDWIEGKKADVREWYAGYRYRHQEVPWDKLDDI